jgi:nitrogen fixation/metabolism regulation signal transduction histidine kinase
VSRAASLLLPWRRSLRARLTLLFALLGLIPALLVGYLVHRNVSRNLDVWETPGLTATMESVRMVARTSVDKLVSNLAVHAGRLIRSPELRAVLADPAGEPISTLRAFYDETELDLVALYEPRDGEWTEYASVCRDTLTFSSEDLDLALQLTSLQSGEMGYLVSAFSFDVEGVDHALLLGYRLGPEYLPSLELIAAGLTYHSQLQLVGDLARRPALWLAAAVTLTSLLVALILGRWVARGVSRPVETLEQGMHQLAQGETVQLVPKGTDELRFLTTSFNQMAHELDVTKRELGKAERLAAWQEMARRIAHEIRNPLTPIQFALHRIRRQTDGDAPNIEAIDQSVNAILEELEGLKQLASTFSTFARLPDPDFDSVALNDLAESVAELARSEERAHVTLSMSAHAPVARADRRGLRRVLTNLVKNAIESGAGEVTIETTTVSSTTLSDRAHLAPGSVRTLLGHGHVVISVSDDGPGVASDALDQIFLPEFTTKPTGSGLGLAITCRIIAQHGGALVVEPGSVPGLPDGGLSFHVHLPQVAPEPEARPA